MIKPGKIEDSVSSRARERARKQFVDAWGSTKPRAGLWLRKWREDHAITQRELAVILNVSTRTLIRAEQAEVLPRVLVLALEGR